MVWQCAVGVVRAPRERGRVAHAGAIAGVAGMVAVGEEDAAADVRAITGRDPDDETPVVQVRRARRARRVPLCSPSLTRWICPRTIHPLAARAGARGSAL